jgi:hypothetical protein
MVTGIVRLFDSAVQRSPEGSDVCLTILEVLESILLSVTREYILMGEVVPLVVKVKLVTRMLSKFLKN